MLGKLKFDLNIAKLEAEVRDGCAVEDNELSACSKG